MFVVVLLVVGVLHRPVARHGQTVRAENRVKERAGNIFEMILGEQLAIDFDAEPVVELRDVNAVFRIRGVGLV